MGTPNRSSPMRVLIRPPPSTTSSLSTPLSTTTTAAPVPSLPPLPPTTSNTPSPQGISGVVVVGFIGKRQADVTQLINRIVDSNVFGSGNADRVLGVGEGEGEISEEIKEWFKFRRISFYHDEVKGVLYLQFCATRCPVMESFSEVEPGFDSVLEEHEFGDLQGLLFMFSVCHVIIYIQEGSRFDIQILKKFRVLQAAKHGLSPVVRPRSSSPLTSKSHVSSSSRTSPSGRSSKNRSPGKGGPIASRNSSAMTPTSGLGSYSYLFPGQCTPVMLFVFCDDYSDSNHGPNQEESAETSSLNQSSNMSSLAKPSLPVKGPGSVVVLSRPVSRSEGGFKKKLQSSLEAQIRFSIKKCRTLTGAETGQAGSRNGTVSNSAHLFSLDASKAVALVDRLCNQRGESLDFATGLVENILNGLSTSDSLLLESHGQSANREDIQSVKDFICRQSDILRGRGGMVTNPNSGSAPGVGMVAVAAAAAAASASGASGKTFNSPELPSLEIWLSSSQLILQGLLSAKPGIVDEPEVTKRKPRPWNSLPSAIEGNSVRGTDPLEVAMSYLDNSWGLNTKFSTLWCQRALPVAKDVYLNDLPACYPTSQHEAHLGKALSTFKSMVKGPAVEIYLKKLEDECTSIWCSGRQLCDAVSLTGKPCIHQRHDTEAGGLVSSDETKPHSSGFVFLHACACGRSRKLLSDPYDFETANLTFSHFPDCDKLLPAVQFPQGNSCGPVRSSSWSLIRLGGAKYYQPAKGLLQSGFCTKEKFLLKWIIFLEKQENLSSSKPSVVQGDRMHDLSSRLVVESVADAGTEKTGRFQPSPADVQSEPEFHRKPTSESIRSDTKKVSGGRGLPNPTMRKPFSEVVAGSAANDSGFPPLQSKKQALVGLEKGTKQISAGGAGAEQTQEITDHQGSQKAEDFSTHHETVKGSSDIDGNPFLQIGSNVVPVTINIGEKIKPNSPLKHDVVYVGFEHECPHGHRFILTPEHLNRLGPTYAADEESPLLSTIENPVTKVVDPLKLGKNGGQVKINRQSNRTNNGAVGKMRNSGRLKDMVTNGQSPDGVVTHGSTNDIEGRFQSLGLDDSGCAFSLLNRNLPLYMDCPHCEISKNKTDLPNAKFAGKISQLQRMFLVTPSFPVILATSPVVQFETSCLPASVRECEEKLQFSFGCPVILPPDSFLSLKFPFVYGVQLADATSYPLRPFENHPEHTAWITKSTILQIVSKSSNLDGRQLT